MRLRACLLVATLAACESSGASDRELQGLVTASATAPRPIDTGRAARDGAELARALAQPWRVATAALGDHRLTIDSTVEVKDGATVLEHLGDQVVIESARGGDYHAIAVNSADYGREVIALGGKLYLRPRYALWHGRAPEVPDEADAIRDQLAAVLGDYLELCARGLEVSDKGAVQAAGRAAHRLELKLAPRPLPVPRAAVTQRAWRDTVVVKALTGEVTLDDELGVALAGKLAAEVAFTRDGKPLTMTLAVSHTVLPIAAPAIAPPPAEQTVATPERAREVDDRNMLLQGIAPPQGKGATADVPEAPVPGPAAPAAPAAPAPAAPEPAK